MVGSCSSNQAAKRQFHHRQAVWRVKKISGEGQHNQIGGGNPLLADLHTIHACRQMLWRPEGDEACLFKEL
jgi:hypothetical protein